MRAADILTTAIGNTFRSRLRTTLTVLAIFIGAFTLTITNGLGTGINQYITAQVDALGAADVITVTKPSEQTDASDDEGPAAYDPDAAPELEADNAASGTTVLALDDDDLDTIADLDGVASVEPAVAVQTDWIEWGDAGKFELSVGSANGLALDLAAGDEPDSSSDEYQIVVPEDYVETMGFDSDAQAVGETVTIGLTDATGATHELTATLVGVQQPTLFGGGATANEALIMALYDAQSIGQPEGTDAQYASATVRVADATTERVDAVTVALEDAGYAGTTLDDQLGTVRTVIDGIILVLNAFAIIALLAAGLGIINTLLMSVQERTREIGLMKAMGMGGGRIFGLFSTEAVFIGFLGSALGSVIAIGLGTAVSGVLSESLLADLGGLNILAFDPLSVLLVILMVMGLAFLAGTLPALRAARQNPIDALRYE